MANSTTVYVGAEGRSQVDVTENKTLVLADCGIIQNVITDGITITLPATAHGLQYIVRNGGVPASSAIGAGSGGDFSCLVTIAPNASDKFSGFAVTPADNKAMLNTKATAKVGDELQFYADGTDGYTIVRAKGVWARQA